MDAVLTEEQQALAEAAQALAASGLVDARTTLDGGDVPARPTEDLFDGFNGLGIDEQDGGAGGSAQLVINQVSADGCCRTDTYCYTLTCPTDPIRRTRRLRGSRGRVKTEG